MILKKCETLKYRSELTFDALTKMVSLLIEKSLEKIDSCMSIESLIESGDITDVQDGNHGNDHPKASEYVDKGIPFVMASDLSKGYVDLESCKKLPKTRTDKLRVGFSKSGDILISHKGTIGLVARVPEIDDYLMLTPQVTYYRVNNSGKISSRFLEIYFRSNKFQRKLISLAAQSTRAYIGITAQKKLLLPIPTPEQREMIENLWEYVENTRISFEVNRRRLDQMTNNILNG